MAKDVFNIPTRQQIRDGLIADILNTIDGAVARGPGDDLWDESEALSGALTEAVGSLALAANEAFATSASFASLTKIATPFIGAPKTATPAQLMVIVSGTSGGSWSAGDQLTSPQTGATYAMAGSGSVGASPPPATAIVQVNAVTPGANLVDQSGDYLFWASPPSGIAPTVNIDLVLTPGVNLETQDAYLQRYLTYRANPPGGGRDVDFEAWALAVDGVGFAKCIPQLLGRGSVVVAVLDPEGDNVSPTVLAAVQAALDANRPDCLKTCVAWSPTLVTQDVTIQIVMAAGFEFSITPTAVVQTGSTSTAIVVLDSAGTWTAGQWVALKNMKQARQIQSALPGSTPGTSILVLTQPLYDADGLPAAPATDGSETAMAGCPSYDQLAKICSDFFLNIAIGGKYYHAALLGKLTQQTDVLNATQTIPDPTTPPNYGDAVPIVDRQLVQKINLGTLILQAGS